MIKLVARISVWRLSIAALLLVAGLLFGYNIIDYFFTGDLTFISRKHGIVFSGVPALIVNGILFAICILLAVYFFRPPLNGSDLINWPLTNVMNSTDRFWPRPVLRRTVFRVV